MTNEHSGSNNVAIPPIVRIGISDVDQYKLKEPIDFMIDNIAPCIWISSRHAGQVPNATSRRIRTFFGAQRQLTE